MTMLLRAAATSDLEAIFSVIDAAAEAYRGVIPSDCWHEPYMPIEELRDELRNGVEFWIANEEGAVRAVMGIQDKGEVALVRHAYVRPSAQGKGLGTKLLRHVEALAEKPVLIGTWAAATWAIEFYRRNGYALLDVAEKDRLLRTYWTIPERQIETSVVLADRRWMKRRGGA